MAKMNLGNTKTRTLLLLGGVLLLIVIITIIMTARKPNPLKTQESQVSKIPQITAIPGNVTSEKYQELQQEDNRRRAEQAKTTGGSAIATIIGSKDKDALGKRETFGIEGDIQPCQAIPQTSKSCEGTEYNKDFTAKLVAELQTTPSDTLKVMQKNPCFAKAICLQNPDLALKLIEHDKEAAKIMLKECPDMAKALAEKNPELFKQLMLENPDLAKKIAETHPEIMKKLMEDDPEFARKMAKVNPDVVKTLMKNDPEFADKMGKANPDMVKDLMKSDPEFARTMAKNNPAMVKKLMLDDPAFANAMAAANPEMVKQLMRDDPAFARQLAINNPALVKELMKNDPAFAALMAKIAPETVKKLMLDDPEFAKAMARSNPEMVEALMADDPAFKKALLDKNPGLEQLMEINKGKQPLSNQPSLNNPRRSVKDIQAERARQIQLSDQQQKQIAALMASMETESKSFYQLWTESPVQKFVAGVPPKEDTSGTSGSSGSGSGTGSSSGSAGGSSGTGEVIVKAGSILFASLDTAINSDEPGPVMATIIQGKFKGAKVIGTLQAAAQAAGASNNRPEKVTLNFASLSMDAFPKSISIQAVAIDPDTARTALASDVDHHYLLRYGTLFASSFMSGYAKVITAQGTTQTSTTAGSTTTQTPTLSPRQQIFGALGEVGKNFSNAASSYFSTPNTITVDAGTGIGLLVLQDITNPAT